MTATFGLKGAHAESADEFDVLLDDVESAGLNEVNRLSPWRSSKPEDVGYDTCWQQLPTNFGEEANDNGKGGGRGKRGQASNPQA